MLGLNLHWALYCDRLYLLHFTLLFEVSKLAFTTHGDRKIPGDMDNDGWMD
jgi:hypothetical protein